MGNLQMQMVDEEELAEMEGWLDRYADPGAEAQDRYESAMVAEARAIVEGRTMKLATNEHLRVVLSWLDGAQAVQVKGMPF